jgi:toxin ParE1/3/4
MNQIIRSSQAELDVVAIGLELTRYGYDVAERALDMIDRRCETLRQFPWGGEACPQFGEQMRWYPAGNYVIFYRPTDEGIEIVRVLDGRRDLRRSFWHYG